MTLKWAAAAAIVLLAAPALGWADPTPQAAPPPAAAASDEATALVKRLFAAIHIDDMTHRVMQSIIPLEMDELSQENTGLTAQQRTVMEAVVQQAADEWAPHYFDRMVSVYVKTFTIDELKASVAFYESPIGQSVVKKSATLAPEAAEIARQSMPELKALIAKRLCERLDCKKLKLPATDGAS